MGFRAREVLERGAQALRRDQAQIGLEAAPEPHAGFRVAVRKDPLDQLVAGEGIHQRRRTAPCEDVEVAARFAAAPETADHGNLRVRRVLAQRSDQAGGGIVRFRHESASDEPPLLFEGLQDERFLLRAHAFHLPDASVARCLFQLLERADAKVAVEPRDRLRPDPLQVQQVQHGRRKLLQQLLVVAAGAGVDELADLRRQILPDALQLQALR